MNVLKALEAIEAAPRGNARLEAIKVHDSPELREFFNLALSPQITFGVKKLPKPIPAQVAILRNEKHWFEELKTMLKLLSSRELTGKQAQSYIGSFLGLCDEVQEKWTTRVIKQDLRLNVGAKDINNVLGDVVFEFSTPLAVDYKKASPDQLLGRWVIQPKLDGARCVAYLEGNGGKVTLYSRTGKVWGNFESVRTKLEEINNLRRFKRNKDIVMDGEVVAIVDDKIDFQAIQHNMFDSSGKETGKLKFFAFDIMERKEWESQADLPYSARFSDIKEFVRYAVEEIPGSVFKLGVVEGFTVENPSVDQLEKHCEGFTMRGFEGAMARREDSKVELKRTKNLLKIKTFLDAEAEIVGFAQGGGKYVNQMGALVCKTPSGVEFELGTGFSDEQRKEFPRKKDLVGSFAVYKYKTLTEDGVPFHTSFKGIRHKDDIITGEKTTNE